MDFIQSAFENWDVVVFFAGLVAAWVRLENVVASLKVRHVELEKKFEEAVTELKVDTQKDVNRLESRMAVQEKLNQTIREDIASIKAVMENTGHNISDIRRVLERLDERLHRA